MPEVLFWPDTKKASRRTPLLLLIDYVDILSYSDIRVDKVLIFQSTYALVV